MSFREATRRLSPVTWGSGGDDDNGGITQMPNISPPQYQGGTYNPYQDYQGGDFGADQQSQYVNDLRSQLGVSGPADIYGAQKGAFMEDATNVLNATGAQMGSMRGGVTTGTNQDALRRSGVLQGLSGLAGQQAMAQQQYDQSGMLMAGAYGRQLGQDRQFGYGVGRDEHRFAQDFAQSEREKEFERNEWNPFALQYDAALNASPEAKENLRQLPVY